MTLREAATAAVRLFEQHIRQNRQRMSTFDNA